MFLRWLLESPLNEVRRREGLLMVGVCVEHFLQLPPAVSPSFFASRTWPSHRERVSHLFVKPSIAIIQRSFWLHLLGAFIHSKETAELTDALKSSAITVRHV